MQNKIVIITGASSGIGEALAKEFAAQGAHIVLAARNTEKLLSLAQSLETQYKIQTAVVATDVSKAEDCERLIAETVRIFGRIDILINNAGISMRALLEEMDIAVLEQVMQVNFYGTVYCTHAALPYILQSQGSIVGISSIAGYRGLPARTGYSASKFAMQGFLETLRTEVLRRNVHVLIACPGFTASNIRNVALSSDGSAQSETPLDEAKLMSAEECARHIYQAVKSRKRTLILTLQGKLTVLLNKLFPAFMDKMVYNHFLKEPNSPLQKFEK